MPAISSSEPPSGFTTSRSGSSEGRTIRHGLAGTRVCQAEEKSSSHPPEDVRTRHHLLGEVVPVVVHPDLVALRDDRLALGLVIGLHGGLVVRCAIAEHPDARLVVKVRLDEQAIDSLLGSVGQTEAMLIEVIDELPFRRGVGIEAAQQRLVLVLVALE